MHIFISDICNVDILVPNQQAVKSSTAPLYHSLLFAAQLMEVLTTVLVNRTIHLEVCRVLAGNLEAEPLIQVTRRVNLEYLQRHR